MLLRICLIVAILAGLAVGGLNFVKVKEKITTLQADLDRETKAHREFEGKYTSTKKTLDKTTAELNQTKTALQAATEAKEKAETDLAAQVKRGDKLNEDLTKTKQDLLETQQQLAAYKATGLTPASILGMNKEIKDLQANLTTANEENRVFMKQIKKLDTELSYYRVPNKYIVLPAGLKGKVLVADPKWNFVVLSIGEEQGVLERGELLVNRNGKLVAKVIVRSVQKDRCIANVLPGWELGEVMEGDRCHPSPSFFFVRVLLSSPRWTFLLLALVALCTWGCATTESENMSEQPWNRPQNWENGLPGGMMNQYR